MKIFSCARRFDSRLFRFHVLYYICICMFVRSFCVWAFSFPLTSTIQWLNTLCTFIFYSFSRWFVGCSFFLLAPLHFNVYNLVQFFLPISRHYIFAFELVVLRIKMWIFFISFAYSLDVHNSPMSLSCSREKCEWAGEGKQKISIWIDWDFAKHIRFYECYQINTKIHALKLMMHKLYCIFFVCVFHMYIIEKSIHHGFWCYRHRNVRPNSACNLPTGKHETKY